MPPKSYESSKEFLVSGCSRMYLFFRKGLELFEFFCNFLMYVLKFSRGALKEYSNSRIFENVLKRTLGSFVVLSLYSGTFQLVPDFYIIM